MKKKKTPAQKAERKKKIFKLFNRVVIGAVKVWLKCKGDSVPQPYIVAIDEVDEFIQEKIAELDKKPA